MPSFARKKKTKRFTSPTGRKDIQTLMKQDRFGGTPDPNLRANTAFATKRFGALSKLHRRGRKKKGYEH